MSAKGPRHLYTYRPKMGDVVIFPNGVELNYSEHDQTVVALAPTGSTLTVTEGLGPDSESMPAGLLIGVRSS